MTDTECKIFTFGAEGSGLYFTIKVTGESGNLSAEVTMIEGTMDLNALWFSDGDTVANAFGSTTLSKADNALNMNGATFDTNGDGTQDAVAWDAWQKLSNAGLGTEGEAKPTFFSEGEPQTISLTFGGSLDDLNYLGVRATSVNGGDSLKLIAEGECPPPPPDEFCFTGLTRGAWGTPNSGDGIWNDGYATGDSLEAVFGIDLNWVEPGNNKPVLADLTLLDAVNFNGGGQNQLIAQAVSALLNAADSASANPELAEDGYRFTQSEIINAVKWAFGLDADIDGNGIIDTNTRADNVYDPEIGEALHSLFDTWNNASHSADGCIKVIGDPPKLFDLLGGTDFWF